MTQMNDFALLQLFAEAGTVTNTTVGYVNSYTGDLTNFDSKNTLAPELKEFYDTELLENARVEMFYAQFGKKQRLPKNHEGTVQWRKWNTFAKAGKLAEGVIPSGQKFGATALTGSIDQYGTYTSISDKLELRAYDDVILGATEEMGASAAETGETLIRDGLAVGTNVLYCENVKKDGTVVSKPTGQNGMHADATNGYAYLTPAMVNKAVTIMKKNRVPKINGKYVAVVHPSVAEDLRSSDAWIEAHKYAAAEQIFNGEIGELHGVRFIENVFAPVWAGKGLANEGDMKTLKVKTALSSAGSTITFDAYSGSNTGGARVAASALVGRMVLIGGEVYEVTANTTSTITINGSVTVAEGDLIYPGEGAADGLAAYATYFFGKDAFGIIDPEGGALQMIIHDKDEIGGPLNQFSTIGYKFETNGATILYEERMLRVMSTSSYSDVDEAN